MLDCHCSCIHIHENLIVTVLLQKDAKRDSHPQYTFHERQSTTVKDKERGFTPLELETINATIEIMNKRDHSMIHARYLQTHKRSTRSPFPITKRWLRADDFPWEITTFLQGIVAPNHFF